MGFSTAITERVWNTRDNPVSFVVKDDGTARNLSAVTRMVLEVGSIATVDTDSTPTAITWDAAGNVTMKLGTLGIADGTYTCELVAYDPANPNGVMLVHPNATAQLTLVFETD